MLKELGLSFEHLPVNFHDGSTRRPEFLRINPNGRVPVLETDAVTLFESMAINLYLARKFPGPLSPVTIEQEALATQWSFWVVTEIEKPLLLASANAILFAPASRNAEEHAIACKKLERPLAVLERPAERKSRGKCWKERLDDSDSGFCFGSRKRSYCSPPLSNGSLPVGASIADLDAKRLGRARRPVVGDFWQIVANGTRRGIQAARLSRRSACAA